MKNVARITLTQLKKYDVSQKIIEALADAESRTILFSTISEEKTAAELSEINHIPISSVYKKLPILEDLHLLGSRMVMDHNRKRFKLYKSLIAKAEINIKGPEPSLVLVPN